MIYFSSSSQKSGRNIDAASAFALTREKKLVKLANGIFADANEWPADKNDVSPRARGKRLEFLRKYGLRIAKHVLPTSALSHACAYMRRPIDAIEGVDAEDPEAPLLKIFVIGDYKHLFKSVPGLWITQSDDLNKFRHTDGIFLDAVIPEPDLDDSERERVESELGPLSMACCSDEFVFLQMFGRRRYNPERFISEEQVVALKKMLLDRHGSRGALKQALLYIQEKASAYGTESQRALVNIDKEEDAMIRKLVHDFKVAWNGRHVANLVNDGVGWHFDYQDGWLLPLSIEQRMPGQIPSFIINLFPEGWQRDMVRARMDDTAHILTQSERYLSNIAMVASVDRIGALPEDVLTGRLKEFSDNGVFCGHLAELPEIDDSFITQLGALAAKKETPRVSGTQMKLPMHLDANGSLVPALNRGFTHIMKLSGHSNDRYNAKGSVEWASMSMVRAGGTKTCEFSLLDMGQEMEPAFVAERFDVRQSDDDMRLFFAEDMCAATGVGPFGKFEGHLEDLANVVRANSTAPEEDMRHFFKMALSAWFIENGDYHKKNISFLKVAAPTLDRYRSTVLAPAYDMMCTKYFSPNPTPEDTVESMCFTMAGEKSAGVKNSDLTANDFVALGVHCGIEKEEVEKIMLSMAEGIGNEAVAIKANLPEPILRYPKVEEIVVKSCDRALAQVKRMFPQIELNEKPPAARPVKKRSRRLGA